MDLLDRLFKRADRKGARLQIRFDPTEADDAKWIIKYYPDPDENANFWAEGGDILSVTRQLLDEMAESE